ncbi:MAG: hypothetical protein WDN25_08490 [Acetobacteraceae bacterium]
MRDPLVAEPLLPRFLAPGDQVRLTVLLHNLDLPAGEQVVTVSVDGPLAVGGPARLAANLAAGAQALPFVTLSATGAGRGIVRLDVAGTGGFHVQRETAITVRPARGATTMVAGGDLAPGAEFQLAPPLDRFIAGTWTASATFGGAVRYDVAGLVQSLDRYPLWCLEQATSRGLPLALLPDGPLAGADRAAKLQQAVGFVLDRQRFDGGFGLWTASQEAEPWLSVYASEFLLRARQAGAAIPEQAVADALKFIADAADDPGDKPEDAATQPYRLYVLALAGRGRPGAARVIAERVDRLPTAARQGATGGGAGAGARPAARRGGVRGGVGRAGAAVVGVRLRHRAARPGGDRAAAEGERAAGGPAGAAAHHDAGRRPVRRHAVHPGAGLGGFGRRRARPQRDTRPGRVRGA